jgi:hypothetical protein
VNEEAFVHWGEAVLPKKKKEEALLKEAVIYICWRHSYILMIELQKINFLVL